MKTIAIVSTFDIYQTQGVNYVTNTFLQGRSLLRQRGYCIKFLVSPNEILDCEKLTELPQFSINRVEQPMCKKSLLRKISHKINNWHTLLIEMMGYYINDYKDIARTKRQLESEKLKSCDIILFQGTGIASKYNVSLKKKFPHSVIIMHTGHSPWEFFEIIRPCMNRYTFTRKFYYNFVRDCIANCDRLVTLSKRASDSYEWVLETKKMVVYNGIKDISVIDPIEHSKVNFVCVASLQQRKGQHLLIDSIQYLPEEIKSRIKIFIVGGGPAEKQLRELIRKNNCSEIIELTGVRPDIPNLLRSMDVFILPSYAEGLPISIIEALRQGLFIMTTDVGGCAEMIEPTFGRIIENKPESIANCIKEVVSLQLYKNCSSKARQKYIDNFSLKSMMNGYADVFDSLF